MHGVGHGSSGGWVPNMSASVAPCWP